MYEGAGEDIPSMDVPAQLIQGRRSLHRVALVIGLGGAALLAWHIFQRLKLAKERAKEEAKKAAAAATANEIKVNGGDGRRPLETNNNRPGLATGHAIAPAVKVTIHQCPRGYLTPCISPFSLKLETYLRINGIPYEVDCATSGEDGNVPWMTIGGEDVRESHECISRINQAFQINLDAGAPQSRLIASRLVSIMLENHIYWGIALWRWVYDQGRTLPHIQPLSATSMATIDDIGQSVNRAAWYHGLGRLSPQQVTDVILKDLGDLSSALGKHAYFMGDSPGEVDCGAFAMLSQMVWNMPGSPFEPAVKQYRNLVDFVLRMRDNFYPDWQNLVQVRGEEDSMEEMMGIFPGSEFLHKRQLNSDSSHWDSKGSSSVTLKQVKVKPVEVKGDLNQGRAREASRQNHVTFDEGKKNEEENLYQIQQTAGEAVPGVQSLPQGFLGPKPTSGSSSVSSRGGGQATELDQQEVLVSNRPDMPMQASNASMQTSGQSVQNFQQFQQQQFQQAAQAQKFQESSSENAAVQQPKFGAQIPMMFPGARAPIFPQVVPMYPNFAYQMPPPPEYSDGGRPGSGFQGQAQPQFAPNFYQMHPYSFQGFQPPPPSRSGMIYEMNQNNNNGAFGSNSSSEYGPTQQQSNRQF